MIGRTCLFVGFVCLAFVGGCGPYVDNFHYTPNPAVVELRGGPPPAAGPTSQPAAREAAPVIAYANIVGVRRADGANHIPLSLEVRLRVDNFGPGPISFDPRSLDLTNSELLRFPPPIVRPPAPVTLEPGQTVFAEANFPFPPGLDYANTDLELLQLHWSIQIDGQSVPQVAEFHRQHYYSPYWNYEPYPYGYVYPYVGFRGAVIIRR